MASKKKGLSLDEKKAKMLELFYESKEFFQMKELEKIGPKQKGVISQSVKDVVQSLVDDGLVECEKIGTFVCYWAFPSRAVQLRKRKFEDLEKQEVELKQKIVTTKEEIAQAGIGREPTEERAELLKITKSLADKEKTLLNKMMKYSEFNPEAIEATKQRIEKAKEDANRWTDNIVTMKKWCCKKFGMDGKMLDKQWEIPEDMDYVE